MSRHHEKAIITINMKERAITFMVTLFIMTNPEATRQKAPLDAKRGQGLISTR
jgi:hypothetical protein